MEEDASARAFSPDAQPVEPEWLCLEQSVIAQMRNLVNQTSDGAEAWVVLVANGRILRVEPWRQTSDRQSQTTGTTSDGFRRQPYAPTQRRGMRQRPPQAGHHRRRHLQVA